MWTPKHIRLREYGVGFKPEADIRHWVEELVLQGNQLYIDYAYKFYVGIASDIETT